jgi:hypothetical protein
MKHFLFFFILIPFQFLGKSFHFPDVDFSYAKIYYFNLGEITSRPDDYIYDDKAGFAKSIEGEGKLSSDGLTANIEKLFLYHKDALLNGLSSCYIPRHGIVYFDKNDQPVASLSICFECGAIRMWTKTKGKIKSSDPKASNGEGQLNTLKQFILKEDIIVSENPNDYRAMIKPKEKVTITYTTEKLDSTIFEASYDDVKSWFTMTPKESVNVEYTAGGRKYEFGELTYDNSIHILFLSNEPSSKIGEATISSNQIVLPNGLKIGSTLDDLMKIIMVYDGPSNPSIITFTDGISKIVYTFEDEILVLITINK